MLCQLSCQGHIDAMLKDRPTSSDALSNGLAQILQEKEESADYVHRPVSPAQVAEILKKVPVLPSEQYAALLWYLQLTR